MNKKIISVKVDEISPYDFDCTLRDLQVKIQTYIDEYGPTARVDWDPNFYYDYDPNPSPRFTILVNREETDEEFAKRETSERVRQQEIREREQAEFERLKKKFGDK